MKSGKKNNSKVVTVPAAAQRIVRNKGPTYKTLPRGDIEITHREYIADIRTDASESFVISNTVTIQPGLVTSFPWLSKIANNFESYSFKKLSFEICTNSGSATPGSVGICIDYDAMDEAPSSKLAAMAMQGSVRAPIWKPSLRLNANQRAMSKIAERYTRAIDIPNSDRKTYDVGHLFVFLFDIGYDQASRTLGELYVEYTIVLKTPQFSNLDTVYENEYTYIYKAGYAAPSVLPGAPHNVFRRSAQGQPTDVAKDYSTSGIVSANKAEAYDSSYWDHYLPIDEPGTYNLQMQLPYVFSAPQPDKVWSILLDLARTTNVSGWLHDEELSATSGIVNACLRFTITAATRIGLRALQYSFERAGLNRMITLTATTLAQRPYPTPQITVSEGKLGIMTAQSIDMRLLMTPAKSSSALTMQIREQTEKLANENGSRSSLSSDYFSQRFTTSRSGESPTSPGESLSTRLSSISIRK